VAQLRLRDIVATREMEDALVELAERLFPAGWVVEIAGEATGKPLAAVGIKVWVRDGRTDVGSDRFGSNQLHDVPPFLERVARLASEGRRRGHAAP